MEKQSLQGSSKLASLIRQQSQGKAPVVMEFGTIQANGALKLDTFSREIPAGNYSICRHVSGIKIVTPEGEIQLPKAGAGDRVLVTFVNAEAVVIDVIN